MMNIFQSSLLAAGIFFLVIYLSGFWLSRSGKPYPVIKFNLHKLVGLVMGVYLIRTVYSVYQSGGFNRMGAAALVITVLCFVLTVAAGGLLSIEKPVPAAVRAVHKLMPYLTALSTAWMLVVMGQGI